jgi:hypothetical protein
LASLLGDFRSVSPCRHGCCSRSRVDGSLCSCPHGLDFCYTPLLLYHSHLGTCCCGLSSHGYFSSLL